MTGAVASRYVLIDPSPIVEEVHYTSFLSIETEVVALAVDDHAKLHVEAQK
jgi:hypothetical protein